MTSSRSTAAITGLALAAAIVARAHAAGAQAVAPQPGGERLWIAATSGPLDVEVREHRDPEPVGLWPAPGPHLPPPRAWGCRTPCALLVPPGLFDLRTVSTAGHLGTRARVAVMPGGVYVRLRPPPRAVLDGALAAMVLGGIGVITSAVALLALDPPALFGSPTGTVNQSAAITGVTAVSIGVPLLIVGAVLFGTARHSATRPDAAVDVHPFAR